MAEDKRIKIYKYKSSKISAYADWKSRYDIQHTEIEQNGK
jgi:hypothetical protein